MAQHRPKADLALNLLCILILCTAIPAFTGCGIDLDQIAEIADARGLQDSQSQLKSAMDSYAGDQIDSLMVEPGSPLTPGDLTSASPLKSTGPYTERENPFEFAMDVDLTGQVGGEDKLEVKLFGFVGEQAPKAIVSINGNTRLMSVGDSWGAVEIVEIHPPSIRFRTADVTKVRSLLGVKDSD